MTKKKIYVALLLSWATVWFLIIPIAPIITIWALHFMWGMGKRRLALLFLLCSPFVVLPIYNVFKANLDYSKGEASIGFLGYPSNLSNNLDPELRLRHTPKGTPTGTEYLTVYPYNTAVRWLIRNKGLQVGSYKDYLPSADVAKSLLQSNDVKFGEAVILKEVLTLALDSSIINLKLEEQPDQIRYLLLQQPIIKDVEYVVQGNCLIISLNKDWIYCIDVSNRILLSHFPRSDFQ